MKKKQDYRQEQERRASVRRIAQPSKNARTVITIGQALAGFLCFYAGFFILLFAVLELPHRFPVLDVPLGYAIFPLLIAVPLSASSAAVYGVGRLGGYRGSY